MYGSNYYGEAYYGQGPFFGTTFILQTVSATVVTVAAIEFQLLINATVSATVTTTAFIDRQFQRIVSATVTTSATFADSIVKALNIRRASTKLLNLANTTRALDGDKETKGLNLVMTTKDTTED